MLLQQLYDEKRKLQEEAAAETLRLQKIEAENLILEQKESKRQAKLEEQR